MKYTEEQFLAWAELASLINKRTAGRIATAATMRAEEHSKAIPPHLADVIWGIMRVCRTSSQHGYPEYLYPPLTLPDGWILTNINEIHRLARLDKSVPADVVQKSLKLLRFCVFLEYKELVLEDNAECVALRPYGQNIIQGIEQAEQESFEYLPEENEDDIDWETELYDAELEHLEG